MKNKAIIFGMAFLLGFSACKKDEESSPSTNTNPFGVDVNNKAELEQTSPTFDPLDGQTVSDNLKFAGSTNVDGAPPATTTDFGTPTLYDYSSDEDQNLRVKNDYSFNLALEGYTLDDVEGVYVQVDGASDYYDVPVTVNDNSGLRTVKAAKEGHSPTGRIVKTQSADIELPIEIPSTITQGTFCLYYCVYTSDGYVSNVISRCIDVQEFGSPDAGFLIGEWNFTSAYWITPEETETIEAGKSHSYTYDDYDCGEVTLSSVTTSFKVTFNADGSRKDVYSGSDEELNEDCSKTVITDNDTEVGAWTYNSSTETLTVLFEPDEYSTEPYFEEYRVRNEGNNLSLSYVTPDEFEGFFSALLNFTK